MFVFVSDLHIGDGGALEDFALWPGRLPRRKTAHSVRPAVDAMHGLWNAFLDGLIAEAGAALRPSGSHPVELILLGDVIDLLQVEGEPRDPAKIHRVARAHKPWFEALRRAARAGIRVSWVAGNHDHELLDPGVWSALLHHAEYLNQDWGGRPLAAWRHREIGIHAEHGSQFDWTNAVDDFADPAALSLGSHVVVGLLNVLEPRYPLLDLMPDVPTALWYALSRAPGILARPLRDFLFGRAAGREDRSGLGGKRSDGVNSPRPSAANLDFLPDVEDLLHRAWMRDLPRPLRKQLRKALSLVATALEDRPAADEPGGGAGVDGSQARLETGRSTGRGVEAHPMRRIARTTRSDRGGASPRLTRRRVRALLDPATGSDSANPVAGQAVAQAAPFVPRLLITGHTHSPGMVEGTGIAAGIRWANTGSWKARALPAGKSRFRIEQPLDVLMVHPDSEAQVPRIEFRRMGEV